jgi:hypothetical protein
MGRDEIAGIVNPSGDGSVEQLAELLDEVFVPALGRAEIGIPIHAALYSAVANSDDLAGPNGANAGEMAFVTGRRHSRQAAGERLGVRADGRHDSTQSTRHRRGEEQVAGPSEEKGNLAGHVPAQNEAALGFIVKREGVIADKPVERSFTPSLPGQQQEFGVGRRLRLR